VQSWSSEHDGAFRLIALIGDLQAGYETVTLTYERATTHPDAHSLADIEFERGRTVIWYDEIDVRPGARYVHSILFHPVGGFDIEFGSLMVGRTPASATDRR
jgi:hypothetical protein